MIGTIKSLFGFGEKTDYKTLVANGAVILDVRTPGEYSGDHIKGSVNIPLDQLSVNMKKLDKNKPVITCCASGMRSASAKNILLSNGFKEVHNAGGWRNLSEKI